MSKEGVSCAIGRPRLILLERMPYAVLWLLVPFTNVCVSMIVCCKIDRASKAKTYQNPVAQSNE